MSDPQPYNRWAAYPELANKDLDQIVAEALKRKKKKKPSGGAPPAPEILHDLEALREAAEQGLKTVLEILDKSGNAYCLVVSNPEGEGEGIASGWTNGFLHGLEKIEQLGGAAEVALNQCREVLNEKPAPKPRKNPHNIRDSGFLWALSMFKSNDSYYAWARNYRGVADNGQKRPLWLVKPRTRPAGNVATGFIPVKTLWEAQKAWESPNSSN